MFGKLWNWVKDNAGKILGAVGGAAFGPVGIVFGQAVGGWLQEQAQRKSTMSMIPEHIREEIDQFADNVVKPIIVEYLQDLGTATAAQLVTQTYVDRLNKTLKKLATLKAYFEYKLLQATEEDQVSKYTEIISGLGSSAAILFDTYEKATQDVASKFTKSTIRFRPTDFTSVGSHQLNWSGAKLITANYTGYAITGVDTNPIFFPITSPGTIAEPGEPITSIPTPVPTRPVKGDAVDNFKPMPETAKKTNNKKYWIMGGVAVAALYLANQK